MLALLLAAPAAGIARGSSQAPSTDRIATLSPVAALPAHIAGSFEELTSCQQAPDGEYFIFDRRAHSVFVAPPGLDTARKLIEIGAEQGRVLDPTAFDLAPDGTFVVADAPGVDFACPAAPSHASRSAISPSTAWPPSNTRDARSSSASRRTAP